MKIKEAIKALKMTRDVRVPDTLILQWINEIEGRVQAEVMLADILDVITYPTDEQDRELLVLPPHDSLYIDWLIYKSDQYNGDMERAQASYIEFERAWRRFAAWYMNTYRPAARKRREQNELLRQRRHGMV